MSTVTDNAICRCCSSEGSFKDIQGKYKWMDKEELYVDMLKDCFDIQIIFSEQLTMNIRSGICEYCINQLRNAVNFRKQVLTAEELLKKRLTENTKTCRPNSIKLEESPDASHKFHDDDDEVDALDFDIDLPDDFEYEVPVKEEVYEPVVSRCRKSKHITRSSSGKSRRSKLDRGKDSMFALARKKTKKKSDVSATPERLEHRVNLTAILQHSNASPFRDKTVRGFSCLYCCKYFQSIEDLRAHTAQQSEKDIINSIIDYKLSYNPIKVDITDLHCNLCSLSMKDLTHLKDHLVDAHNKKIYKDIKDIILPFRLEDGNSFKCVVCSVVHVSFKNLYLHMSHHYRNYCCKKCGAGYITIAALRKHGKTHEQGNFPCDYCNKTYTSISKKRNHEKGVHTGGWLRNKCPRCPRVFVSYYDRSEHMVEEHNEAPVTYPCNACSKVYKKKFELNRHIKHHHLQQKSFLCDLCNAKFFSKRGLADHISRHYVVNAFFCDVCAKTFARLRTLQEHLKIHEHGKRFQCGTCKKTFTQKYSLKSHLRLHQADLEVFKEFEDVRHLVDDRDLTLKQIAEESKVKEQHF